MANHFSALKRMRQSEKREAANRARRSRLRHTIREMRRAIKAGDPEKARALLPDVVSIVDKSLKRGVVKENTAARFKSRLMKRLTAAGTPA
jgi:small subunit ribosomal protein S20